MGEGIKGRYKICERCGKRFLTYDDKETICCRRIHRLCKYCGKGFYTHDKKRITCSKKCTYNYNLRLKKYKENLREKFEYETNKRTITRND